MRRISKSTTLLISTFIICWLAASTSFVLKPKDHRWRNDFQILLQETRQQHSSPSQSSASSAFPAPPTPEISIRSPNYGEMRFVANVIMDSFYANALLPARQLYRLAELGRLQLNFPYDRFRHRMFIALAKPVLDDDDDEIKKQTKWRSNNNNKNSNVVGFCDVDARTPNQATQFPYDPRPYISDLCVAPDFRRLGIAQMLVDSCEKFCQELGYEEAFVRVEPSNEAALRLYNKLGYKEYSHPLETPGKTILLQKNLCSPGDQVTKSLGEE
ncbi:hypothetical protein ACA910_005878 [Epithemia clementina (nom. ined.)]